MDDMCRRKEFPAEPPEHGSDSGTPQEAPVFPASDVFPKNNNQRKGKMGKIPQRKRGGGGGVWEGTMEEALRVNR